MNVPSSQLATMDLIEPGDPVNSYLLHKLQGTQSGVGGSGGQMPLGGPPLSNSEIDLVEQWIVRERVPENSAGTMLRSADGRGLDNPFG